MKPIGTSAKIPGNTKPYWLTRCLAISIVIYGWEEGYNPNIPKVGAEAVEKKTLQ